MALLEAVLSCSLLAAVAFATGYAMGWRRGWVAGELDARRACEAERERKRHGANGGELN